MNKAINEPVSARGNVTDPFLKELQVVLHWIAGVILLLFGVSHFGFLTISTANHGLHNTVFPFLTNSTVYFVAALFELSIAIICLRSRGREFANVMILTFVAIIAWYRWAFYYTGGSSCDCLGLLAKLLHLTKAQETSVPIATLIILTVTTTPWLVRI